MIRVVKPAALDVNAPEVMPAPTINSFALVVVAVPLVAVADVPAFDAVTSNGFVGSSPLYSATRTSTNGVDASSVTVTTFEADWRMFFA